MKDDYSLQTRRILFSGVLMASIFAMSQAVIAQTQPTQNTRQPDPSTRPKVRANLEAINQRARELGLVAPNQDEDDEFYRRRMNAQLNQDFIKLHTINDETIAAMSSGSSPDYKALAEAAADIRNRANRIKYNVALLQNADKGEKIRYDENVGTVGSMLPELNRLINSFLSSPIFRFSSPNDVELRSRTCRDLQAIIKLSETISKVAKRMIKTPVSGK